MSNSYGYSVSQLQLRAGLGILTVLAMLGTANTASAQVTITSATTLKNIKIVRGPDASATDTVDWQNLPGASLNFTVQPGESYLFVTRFTAESVCYGGSGWCPVRVLVNGVEASPVVGYDFAFDSTEGGNASSAGWKSHAVDRSYHFTNNGTKTLTLPVVVQFAVTDASILFRLDDWQFTVEQFE